MKNFLLSLSTIVLVCSSCTKEGLYTRSKMETTDVTQSTLISAGPFQATSGIDVQGAGELRVQNEQHFIWLSNFQITSGPDLKVYLSKSAEPDDFVNLGAYNPNQFYYPIPTGIDLAEYDYVLIHCQQYNHLFSFANLQ